MIDHPLRFLPIFKNYLWGGNRLNQWLGKACGDQPTAESWELVDHLDGQSIVAEGPQAGKSIAELLTEQGTDIVGQKTWDRINQATVPQDLRGRFPLLFKFLDANQVLSVQVHPSDQQAAKLAPPDLGKTEAWYIMRAEPGSMIYAGLKAGVGEFEFERAVKDRTIESVLHGFIASAGDLIFIPAGTVHAIGAGLVVAEIQQASNTTYRLFDWNRIDRNGRPRALHIQQALDVIDFQRGPVQPIRAADTLIQANEASRDLENQSLQSLVCDKFILQRKRIVQATDLGGDGQMRLLVNLGGELMIERDPANRPLKFAETILLPACIAKVRIQPVASEAEYLEIKLPLN